MTRKKKQDAWPPPGWSKMCAVTGFVGYLIAGALNAPATPGVWFTSFVVLCFMATR